MKIIKILLGVLILIFLINNVSAFGVASPFASDSPVVVAPGESKELVFSIQNGAGAVEDINAKVEILDGKDIAKIIGNNVYLVPAGGEVPAKIRVNVPKSATKDDKWTVKISVKTIAPNEAGAMNIGHGIITGFDVLTVPLTKPEIPTGSVVKENLGYNNFLVTLILVVIVGVITYLIQKGNKPKLKKKNKTKGKKK